MSDKNQGSIGLLTCVTLTVGGMIGSAIFSLSGVTIYNAGPAALVSWILAAIIMLMYGLQIAELSTIFPKSGGVFVFPSKSLGKNQQQGRLWGWISTWGYINANIIAIAFAAIYVATYLGVGFAFFADKQIPMAIIACVVIFVLNSLKFSVAGKANTVLVIGLAATMLTFVAIAFISGQWDSATLTPFFSQGSDGTLGFLGAVPKAMVAYGSIVAIAFMVSEVKDPNKNVPRSILIAMGIVITLYGLVILATVGLVSAEFLADNPGMRFIPLYAACFTKLMAYPWLTKVISLAAVLALLTTMLVVTALTARAIAAAAEGGILPAPLAANNKKTGTPMNATILVSGCSIIVSCFPQFTQAIVSFAALFAAITISINCVSLLTARKKNLGEKVAYRAPGGNFVPVITLMLILVCYIPDVMNGGWVIWAYTIGWYLLGLIVFKLSPAGKTVPLPQKRQDG